MTIFLDRIDAAPIIGNSFDYPFNTWVSVLVNVLNENMGDIQNDFNLLTAQGYTSAQITAMFSAGTIGNGIILYDTDLNEYVGMQSGALVKFTTAPYP